MMYPLGSCVCPIARPSNESTTKQWTNNLNDVCWRNRLEYARRSGALQFARRKRNGQHRDRCVRHCSCSGRDVLFMGQWHVLRLLHCGYVSTTGLSRKHRRALAWFRAFPGELGSDLFKSTFHSRHSGSVSVEVAGCFCECILLDCFHERSHTCFPLEDIMLTYCGRKRSSPRLACWQRTGICDGKYISFMFSALWACARTCAHTCPSTRCLDTSAREIQNKETTDSNHPMIVGPRVRCSGHQLVCDTNLRSERPQPTVDCERFWPPKARPGGASHCDRQQEVVETRKEGVDCIRQV